MASSGVAPRTKLRTSAAGIPPPSTRTVFVVRQTGTGMRVLRVGLIWVVIGLFMATADALSPHVFIRVSAWVSLFFLGVLLSFWALLSLERAAAATGALIGIFLGPYSLTWQLWVTYGMHWSTIFPVRLYPFGIALDPFEWYLMMTIGMAMFIGCLAALARLSRPSIGYIRVHPESGQAYWLGDPPYRD